MSRRKPREVIEVSIEALGSGGTGLGTTEEGEEIEVLKPAPPGARLRVQPLSQKKGRVQARRLDLLQKPKGWEEPRCKIFGLCGGCSLQELRLEDQRQARFEYGLRQIRGGMGLPETSFPSPSVTLHPCRGGQKAYAYRNKVEMSWGTRRFLSQEDHDAGHPIEGRWLGFHAGGWFDRIVDAPSCSLLTEAANVLVSVVRRQTLQEGQPRPWDVREHKGFWRHLLIRQGMATSEILLGLYTAPPTEAAEIEAVEGLVTALFAEALPEETRLVGVVWLENAAVSDVAQGSIRKVWGSESLEEKLGDARYRLSIRSFFQTSTEGAVVLYDTIKEALGKPRELLYDLYCGLGSIGIYLADHFARVIGVEENPDAVRDAGENARLNGLGATEWIASRMEDALSILPQAQADHAFVVDPPRAGLHKKVAEALAKAPGDLLIYVACNPASLGRDALLLQAGGWEMTDLWAVDLFPQTAHIETVARFVRRPVVAPAPPV